MAQKKTENLFVWKVIVVHLLETIFLSYCPEKNDPFPSDCVFINDVIRLFTVLIFLIKCSFVVGLCFKISVHVNKTVK